MRSRLHNFLLFILKRTQYVSLTQAFKICTAVQIPNIGVVSGGHPEAYMNCQVEDLNEVSFIDQCSSSEELFQSQVSQRGLLLTKDAQSTTPDCQSTLCRQLKASIAI